MSTEAISETVVAEQRRQQTFRRWIGGFAAFSVFLVGVRLAWGYVASHRLEVEIADIKAAGERFEPQDFAVLDRPPKEDNAATYYLRANDEIVEKFGGNIGLFDLTMYPESYEKYPDVFKSARRANEAAIDLVRVAGKKEHAAWPLVITKPMVNSLISYLSEMRGLTRFLQIMGLSAFLDGDHDEVITICNDMVTLSERLQQPSEMCTVITRLASGGIWGTAAELLEEVTPRLAVVDSDQKVERKASGAVLRERVERLITRILDDKAVWQAHDDGLVWDRASYAELMIGVRNSLNPAGVTSSPSSFFYTGIFGNILGKPLLDLDTARTIGYLNQCRRAVALRDWQAVQEQGAILDRAYKGNQWTEIAQLLSRNILPTVTRAAELTFRDVATRRMAAIALAIRLYEIDHGERPEKLDDLVPNYLPSVPIDPFASPPQPFGYLPEAEPPVLYCVDADGVDQGGMVRSSGLPFLSTADRPYYLNGDRPHREIPKLGEKEDEDY